MAAASKQRPRESGWSLSAALHHRAACQALLIAAPFSTQAERGGERGR